MASLVRTFAILTLPAAALGALGGLALRAVYERPDAAETSPDGDRTEEDGAGGGDPVTHSQPPRVRAPRPRAERARAGDDRAESAPKLDPALGRRLSSADEATRLAAALEILEMSPPWQSVDALPISGEPATKLRDSLVNSLEALGRIQRGTDWPKKSEGAKLQVRLKYFGKVVPDALLAKERRRFYEICVEADASRVASGAVRPGEASWHKLELARVRHELKEIDDAEWRRVHEAEMGAMRAWVAELASRSQAGRDEVKAAQEALARLESAR